MQTERTNETNDRKKIKRLLILLLLLVFVTGCLLLALLAQQAKLRTGEILDTIVLDPEQEEEIPLAICGRLVYTDGTPVTGQQVVLHSDPMTTTSDATGNFLFTDVERGEHTLSLLDKDGKETLLKHLNLQADGTLQAGEQIFTLTEDDSWTFALPENALVLEIDIQLDTENQTLTLVPESVSALCADGSIYTNDGKVEADPDGALVTSHHSVLLPDGTVHLHVGGAILNNGMYVTSDGKLYYHGVERDRTELPAGYELDDTTLRTPDGATLQLRDGDTELADGTTVDTSSPSTDTTKDNTGDDTTDNTATDTDAAKDTQTTTGKKDTTTKGNSGKQNTSDKNSQTGKTDKEKTARVYDTATDKPWTQVSTIDLFRHAGKLQPGSRGSYRFYVKNGLQTALKYQMTITESAHEAGAIPLEYRIKDGTGAYVAGTDSQWLTADALEKLWVSLGTEGRVQYTLEWRWPYEQGTGDTLETNDTADTRLGMADNSTHRIQVTMQVETAN